MKKRMGIQLRIKLSLRQVGAVVTKPVLLLVAVLLVFSSAGVACTEEAPPKEITIPAKFILVGTDDSSTAPLATGNILLYEFTSGTTPFASPTNPMVVARFTSGIVQGLDILDYENDGDLDFIALVRYETTTSDVWRYVLYFYENVASQFFSVTTIPNTLPEVRGAWNAALADSTAADFDTDGNVDFIVSIGGNATPLEASVGESMTAADVSGGGNVLLADSTAATMIYKFKNNRTPDATPFTQLDNPLTEAWATHARRMDSVNFNGDGRGDFATFDYPNGADFHDDVVIRGNNGAFDFTTTYYITHNTIHSIQTIAAGQFNADTSPDIIVGGDDDGDPGQYWLYVNPGHALWDPPTEVFDLNPTAEPATGQSPGGGVADAYDFNTAGLMDIVATAGDMNGMTPSTGSTTIWYIESSDSGTFNPPAVIDIITTAKYGIVFSIAAPMTTKFGVG